MGMEMGMGMGGMWMWMWILRWQWGGEKLKEESSSPKTQQHQAGITIPGSAESARK